VSVVALIDGEHYPPVVRYALEQLALTCEVVGAAFIGGTEKVDLSAGEATYGVPVVYAPSPAEAITIAIERFKPAEVVDLSDEPVISSAGRFALASIALGHGVGYRGADFQFTAPAPAPVTRTPALAIIGTGKRVGKTAVSAAVARRLKAAGRDVVILAMGRGGPAEPELIRGDQVALTTGDLLELAAAGKHASSDNYEDAVMSRVTTVGCRRCGGGMAGETFFSNVPQGAELADSLGKELLVLEGSGAAIPPVSSDAAILVIGAAQGAGYVRDFFGPYRVRRVDAVVVTGAEEPLAEPGAVDDVVAAIRELRPDMPIALTTLRPHPLEDISGKRVFFATTAPPAIMDRLVHYLEQDSGCTVVSASSHLSDRALLREDMRAAVGTFDVLVTELKAAAIDVLAAVGAEAGVPTVLCDNVPVSIGGDDFASMVDASAATAIEQGISRRSE